MFLAILLWEDSNEWNSEKFIKENLWKCDGGYFQQLAS